MSKVWKVASRWSDTGTAESSVLDIFRTHNIVFVGRSQETFKLIEIGDLVAISDGKNVVAMGKAMTLPVPITQMSINLTEEEKRRFHLEDWVWCCHISFVDLPPDEYVSYRIGTCHQVHERQQQFIDLYEKYHQKCFVQNQFSISSRCCTLLATHDSQALFDKGLTFRIPIYQRPYSWQKEQISKLMSDLLDGFNGENGKYPKEPAFIGTIQLSEKKKSDDVNGKYFFEVVDGQQRLSTLILLLKLLKEKCDADHAIFNIDLNNILETKVNNGLQNDYLRQAVISNVLEGGGNSLNPYLRGLQLIIDEFKIYDSEENENVFVYEEFANYVLNQIYFVVIETRAGLSKTLQIFDSINRAGMDLNGGDVFKVRYYEYLRQYGADESIFNQISDLYQSIDLKNKDYGAKITSIESILSYYQHILIARHKLPSVLHGLSSTTFFERFFDVVLQVNTWPDFSYEKMKDVRIDINELESLIKIRFDDHEDWQRLSEKSKCDFYFIWWSRYPGYSYMAILFRFAYKNVKSDDLGKFVKSLSKLFIIWSVCQKKAVNEIHRFMQNIQSKIFDVENAKSYSDIIDEIQEKISECQGLKWHLENEEFAFNAKAKNLVCRLSAMLEDVNQNLSTRLFESTEIDIEHIEPANNQDGSKREDIWAIWKKDLHGLGNLIILDRKINRSIGNNAHSDKMKSYMSSSFKIVRDFSQNNLTWNYESCLNRKAKEVEKIYNYLMNIDYNPE